MVNVVLLILPPLLTFFGSHTLLTKRQLDPVELSEQLQS